MGNRRSDGGTGRPLSPSDPRQVGPYELLSRLGAGGMGTVYLGRHPKAADGQLVAVKVLRPELARDEAFFARFRDEATHAARVASFCTAQVLDHGTADGHAYMVTEYIAGPSLKDKVAGEGPLSPGMLHGVAVGVTAALVAIHAADLIHRDLKPGNVLLSMSGPRVIDFGIARALDAAGHTKAGEVMGSPGWIAPEQLLGRPVTAAADVFAWGCLLAYAGNGRHPFGEGDFQVMAARTVHADPDLGTLPAPLAELVRAALHKDPDQRPTGKDLLMALVGGMAGGSAGEAEVTTTLNRTWQSQPVTPSAAHAAGAEPETQPPGARAAGRRRGRPGQQTSRAALAVIGASAVMTAVTGVAVLWAGADGPAGRTPAGPPLPTDPLLVRLDTAGWPNPCHADIARIAPGAAASPPVTLSAGDGCDTHPQWSPDRSRIAFTRKKVGASEAWVMNADGSHLRRVARGTFGNARVAWAPNGRRLVYQGADREFYVVSSGVIAQGASGTRRQLTFSGTRKSDPAWSPDGRFLAFWQGAIGKEQIHLLDLRNPARAPVRLTAAPHGAVDPAWSPDGRRLAYTRGTRTGNSDIWVVNVDGTGGQPLGPATPDREVDPSWSPDGHFLAFTKGPREEPRTWAMCADGTGARPLTGGTRREGHPAWS